MKIRNLLGYSLVTLTLFAITACWSPNVVPVATPTLVPLASDAVFVETDIVEFELEDYDIEVGTWIIWNNKTTVYHRIGHTPLKVGEQLEFKGPEIAPGDQDDGLGFGSYRHQFNRPGTFHYRCYIHGFVMRGNITVR